MQDTRMHASEQRLLLAHMSSRITESRMTCIPFSAKNSVQKRDGVGKTKSMIKFRVYAAFRRNLN